MLDMLFNLSLFCTCITAKLIKHQTRRGETLKNGCEPHYGML